MQNSYFRSYVKDNLITFSGQVLVNLKGILLLPLIINLIGVSSYGGYALLTSLLGIIYGISSFGIGVKMQRFLPGTDDPIIKANYFYNQFYFQLFVLVAVSLLLLLLIQPVNQYFFKNEVSYSYFIMPFYLLSNFLYSQSTNYFRFTSRMHLMTIPSVLVSYLDVIFILIIILVFNIKSLNILFYSQIISFLIVGIPLFSIVYREIGIKFSKSKIYELIYDIKIGFPLIINYLLDFILVGSDRYLIALFLTVKDVGFYTPAYILGSVIVFIPKTLGTTVPQLLSKAIDKGDKESAVKIIDYSIKYFLLAAIPFVFGCAILSSQLLEFLTNREVAQHSEMIPFWIAIGTLFYGMNLILTNVLFVLLKTKSILKMNVIASVFNFVLNLILLYYFRTIIVAAITTTLSYLIAFLYVYESSRKYWPIKISVKVIYKAIISSLIMAVSINIVSYLLKEINNTMALLIEITSGFVIYTISLLMLKTFEETELSLIKNKFKKVV